MYDYEGLCELSKELKRPASTLYALANCNDPFYILPFRQVEAEWFAGLWRKYIGEGTGIHIRRLHYKLISQKTNKPNITVAVLL